ncbi:MAG: AAA family ATPase, partial [Pseudoalteromonas sp.]
IEDLPGMGKTTLSHALSAVLGLSYQRIQFTSDLLPADILGTNVFNSTEHSFTFHKGPIFSQVVLADEINRAGPKTQSALLEAMEEQQVTVDGKKYTLPNPFFVIATQNPLYQSGTYPLPESQLDRFLMRISLGFPPKEAEKRLILNMQKRDYSQLPKRINQQELAAIQSQISQITLSSPVIDYII